MIVSANDRQQHSLPNWLTLHMNFRYTVTVSNQCVMTFCIKVDQYLASAALKTCQVDLTYSCQGATNACDVDPKLSRSKQFTRLCTSRHASQYDAATHAATTDAVEAKGTSGGSRN